MIRAPSGGFEPRFGLGTEKSAPDHGDRHTDLEGETGKVGHFVGLDTHGTTEFYLEVVPTSTYSPKPRS